MPIILLPSEPTTPLESLLPFVQPQLKRCPDETAVFALRQAAIELCERTLVWRQQQEPITSIADTTRYAYQLDSNARMHRLMSVTVAGEQIRLLGADQGRVANIVKPAETYAYGLIDGFEIRPAPAADLAIVTEGALLPTLAATTLPTEIAERYGRQLAHGALWQLYGHTDREYGNLERSSTHRDMWETAIGRIQNAAWQGHSRSRPRARAAWF